jgi:hypothetical protein
MKLFIFTDKNDIKYCLENGIAGDGNDEEIVEMLSQFD